MSRAAFTSLTGSGYCCSPHRALIKTFSDTAKETREVQSLQGQESILMRTSNSTSGTTSQAEKTSLQQKVARVKKRASNVLHKTW